MAVSDMRRRMMKTIKKAGLACIELNRLLLVMNAGTRFWIVPGGRIEEGEEPRETLKREIIEELSCELDEESMEYLGVFEDIAANDADSRVEIQLYKGQLKGKIQVANEIAAMDWMEVGQGRSEDLSPIVANHIIPFLLDVGILRERVRGNLAGQEGSRR